MLLAESMTWPGVAALAIFVVLVLGLNWLNTR